MAGSPSASDCSPRPLAKRRTVLAARGVWVTNEKTLLTLAGLPEIDGVVADARPEHLVDMVDAAHQLMSDAVASARGLR
jgi:hypothetical protein